VLWSNIIRSAQDGLPVSDVDLLNDAKLRQKSWVRQGTGALSTARIASLSNLPDILPEIEDDHQDFRRYPARLSGI